MANTKSTNDFNRLQAELFYKQTTSTSRKRRNKPSTPTTVTTKTTILVSMAIWVVKFSKEGYQIKYASSRMPRLVAHQRIFRLPIYEGEF